MDGVSVSSHAPTVTSSAASSGGSSDSVTRRVYRVSRLPLLLLVAQTDSAILRAGMLPGDRQCCRGTEEGHACGHVHHLTLGVFRWITRPRRSASMT
jgi:hypothetical protein